jgi:hypothetical protein
MKEFSFTVAEYVVHVDCLDLDSVVLLLEAQHRGIPLGGPNSAQYLSFDKMPRVAHTSVNDDSAGLIRCSVPVRREASGVAGLRSAQ